MAKLNKIRHRYNSDRVRVISDVGNFETDEEILTQQQFKDDCDINNIVKRYMNGEDISRYQRSAYFTENDEIPTKMELAEAMQLVRNAQEQFSLLPAEDRDRFNNDPQEFFDFMHNPSFEEDAIRRGYKPAPVKTEATPEPPGVTPPPPNPPPAKKD